ncbi:MAG TPA: hypothetical protein VFI47_20490, partial [Acidimicrobiales bacterium]|nr:hypothetical protein [Acidimicrobiales bacterium]
MEDVAAAFGGDLVDARVAHGLAAGADLRRPGAHPLAQVERGPLVAAVQGEHGGLAGVGAT